MQQTLVRRPSVNFAAGLTTAQLGEPDVAQAREQHAAYCDALRAAGLTVHELPDEPQCPDATFVEDTAIVTAALAVVTRPGAPSRRPEVPSVRLALERLLPRVETMEAPGTLDGGDVCQLEDRRVVWEPLARHVAAWGLEALVVDEAEAYGANCLALPDRVLVASECPGLHHRLGRLEYRVQTVDMSEFRKQDGGLTCLSLRW